MKLYIRYLSVLLKSQMQHKASFFMSLIGQGLTSLTTLIGIVFMFSRFDQVKGFTFSEVLLCFSSVLMAFSLAECFARGFDTFSKMLANGEFDRIMVRPRALMFQVLAQKADFARLGRAIEAAIVFGYAIAKCSVSWTLPKALVLAEMVLCGAAVFSGVFVIYAALSFFTGASQFEEPTGAISAAAIVVTIPIVIVVLIFQRRIVSGLTAGGLES